MRPETIHIGIFEVIDRVLQFLGQSHIAIGDRSAGIRIARPDHIVDRIHILHEGAQTLEPISQLSADGVQIETAALLEVSELGDLHPIHHHLPAHAPRAHSRPFPVIFLEFQVVFLQVDADRFKRLEVQLLHIDRRRLQNQLKLCMPEEPVGILAVAAIGRPPRGLRVAHAIGFGPQHAQKRLRRHGARANFNIERLLEDAAARCPKTLQAEQQLLKGERSDLGLR